MARHQQWHSARDGERVHHDNEDCPDGQNIDYYWLRHHTGGRPLCANCARLNTAALLHRMPDAGDRPIFTRPR